MFKWASVCERVCCGKFLRDSDSLVVEIKFDFEKSILRKDGTMFGLVFTLLVFETYCGVVIGKWQE